jgi:hypothetical protein
MNRRELVSLLGGAAAGWPLPLSAQQASKVHRIGFLRFGPASGYAGPGRGAVTVALAVLHYRRRGGCLR